MAQRAVALLIAAHAALFVGAVIVLAATGTLERSALIAVAAALGTAFVLSAGLTYLIFRPVPRLITASRRIAQGDLRSRADVAGGIAIGELTDAFNEMTRSVEELVDAAARERNRLTAVLNSDLDAVVALDQDGRITFANAAAEQVFGRSQEQLLGNPFAWALADEKAVEAVRRSRDEGRPASCTIEREGRRYLEVLAAPIVGGGEWSALVVARDVTDVRRTEQVRRDFVANVSHELRTPLA
ncbi:MAG: PAS domain S-box protein, partial [Dehalococcoidia bacterium]|nr:PAS domain S-box protein [Dehalococcoidia bacterium]